MPTLIRSDGLTIKIFFNDHPPPHVHVYAGRVGHPGVQAARLSIEDGEMMTGKLPPAKVYAVKEWCEKHREQLLVDWERAHRGEHPVGRYHSL